MNYPQSIIESVNILHAMGYQQLIQQRKDSLKGRKTLTTELLRYILGKIQINVSSGRHSANICFEVNRMYKCIANDIVSMVDDIQPTTMSVILSDAFNKWPENSGSFSYPIKAPSHFSCGKSVSGTATAYFEYVASFNIKETKEEFNNLMWKGEYGRNRMDALLFCMEYLENLDD